MEMTGADAEALAAIKDEVLGTRCTTYGIGIV
jgi:hypothetical protein